MKKIFLFILLSLVSTSALAEVITETKIKTEQGDGYGATYDMALSKALTNALGSMNGVTLSSNTFMSVNSQSKNKDRNLEKFYQDEIFKVTNGSFDSYKVISSRKVDDGFKVRVKITKKDVRKKYKTPGINHKSRRNLVIVPTVSSNRSYSNTFTQALIDNLTKTRKFNVLDRNNSKAFENESKLIKAQDTDDYLKLGQALSADYLLVSKIEALSVSKRAKSNITAAHDETKYINARVSYKILTMATRQVKWSNTVSTSFTVNNAGLGYIVNRVSKVLSQKISSQLLENIYPLKVVKVKGKTLIVNQGSLKKGQYYAIYNLGEKLYDSYTGESLGKIEEKVGEAKIIKTLPKYSVAKITSGSEFTEGDVLRPINKRIPKAKRKSSSLKNEGGVKVKSDGGVVLPF